MLLQLDKNTQLCLSLSARPGNFGTRFQNFLYRELGLDFIYKACATQDIAGALTGMRALGVRGAAVSMPFKETCMAFLDSLDASAQNVGSVNTIVNQDGHLKGHNTDVLAVRKLLEDRALPVLQGSDPFTLLGSGGMAKAVAYALRQSGFTEGRIVSRNAGTGAALAAKFGYTYEGATRSSLVLSPLLINTTPVGMSGGPDSDTLAFPEKIVRSARLVFDVVAVPAETPLIRKARELGKPVITGADVIGPQAVEQFVLYTGVRPTDEQVSRAIAFALGTE